MRQGDDQKVKDFGVRLAVQMVTRIASDAHADVRGFHFCTLNLEKSVQRIIEMLRWAPSAVEHVHNRLISVRFRIPR